jgi:plasmid stabilization system protein ParE
MTKNNYCINLSRRAEGMLLQHTEFLARVSPAAARRLISSSKEAKNKLADNPYQFPFADELDVPGIPPKTYRKCLFAGRYKALFLIEENDVFIDAVIDCRQENKNLFSSK